MKKVTVTMIAMFFTTLLFAQEMQEKSIPDQVKTSFKQKYSNAKEVKWEKEDQAFEASFEMNKVHHSVLIDTHGNIIETEVEIELKELPVAILEYLKKHGMDKKSNKAAKITGLKGETTYEVEYKSKDLIFDNHGKFIREINND